jgi:hypothetical protein
LLARCGNSSWAKLEVTIPHGRSAESKRKSSSPGQSEMREKTARLSRVKIVKARPTLRKPAKRRENLACALVSTLMLSILLLSR